MDILEEVRKILRHRNRNDLVLLLMRTRLELDVSNTYGTHLYSQLTTAEIYAPLEIYEHLRALSEKDKEMILHAMLEVCPPRDNDMEINHIEFRLDTDETAIYGISDDELLCEIELQRDLMITVATGGPRIDTVNKQYIQKRDIILSGLEERNHRDPNPYSDLWAWYGKWSSGDLPTYHSRRKYINGLYAGLISHIKADPEARGAQIFEEPTGWTKVDRCIGEVRRHLEEASTEEQYQAVGLLCRETLISLAQTIYDPSRHSPRNGVIPSDTDAKRMLELYLSNELAGRSNEAARKHAKTSLSLANDLQHRRTANFRQTALCAEATTSVVNLIAIISGQRDP